jgi:hypothetical protein
MNTQGKDPQAEKKGVFRLLVPTMVVLINALFLSGCLASYRNVRDISEMPADRSATIRIAINTTKDGKILQKEIEKDYWTLPAGPYTPYPILNYEWYLWLAMDHETFPLISKGRTFTTNVSLIQEGDAANLTREYPVPAGKHTYWIEFAGMKPYVYTRGSGGEDEGGDGEIITRLGAIWNQCFSADLTPGQVVTIQIEDNGIQLPKEVKVEPMSNCHQWLLGPPVETWKRNLP